MSLDAYSKKRFLIVDELDTFRFSTKKTLLSLGIKLVDTASTASNVLSSLQNVDYDVILCNFELGKGKNGQELLEELRYRKLLKFRSLFFIVTGEVAKANVMGTIENEPDGYLVKPITPAELMNRLVRLLDAKEDLRAINHAIDDGDFEKALQACDEKLHANTKYRPTCLKTKAWLLTRLERFNEAKKLYQDILSRNRLIWAEFALAKLYIDDKEFDQAESLLNQIISTDSNRVEALDLLADMCQKKNETGKAQEFIESAIKTSPNSLLRQKKMADLCIKNNQPEGAINAFRKVIKLGDQSIYARPEQYFEFANHLANTYKDDHSVSGKKHIKEAFELLGKAQKRFSEDSQIEQQVDFSKATLHAKMGDTEKAEEILEQVNKKLEKRQEKLSSSTAKLAAQTLISLHRQSEAEKILEDAADNARGDPKAISDIYNLLKEQISLEDRQKAADLNKRGIKLYNTGDVDQAIEELRKAISLTPRHISLNLNLIQVLLKRMKNTATASKAVFNSDRNECQQRFRHIRHMPKHHREFKRLMFLQKQFRELGG
ncbi:MAG: hypothetical protein CSB48_12335 [Proteobacteria bacterium]|nr:MAG: hypothetical protein CSB48_12335 [Pseudomonadota bacterium]